MKAAGRALKIAACVFLMIVLGVTTARAAAAAKAAGIAGSTGSGTLGEGLTWSLDPEGVLVISGEGTMTGSSAENQPFYAYRESVRAVEVKAGVRNIAPYAFYEYPNLIRFTAENSLERIGNYAFSWCENLASVELPDTLTMIDCYAFDGCGALAGVDLPEALTCIGGCAFRDCTSLREVVLPGSLEYLSGWAEADGSWSGTGIWFAFENCTSLTKVTVNSNLSNAHEAFSGCSALKTIEFGSGVTTIPYGMFGNCGIERLVLPAGLTDITGAFRDCAQLKEVTLPASMTVINEAFSGCTALGSIEIPAGITSAGSAFTGCEALKSASLGEGMETVPAGIFRESGIENLSLPASLTAVGEYAFYDCPGLTSVTLPGTVTFIGNYAFSCCENLASVELPDTLTMIDCYAFDGCGALAGVDLPEALTCIGGCAFRDCTSLREVVLPGSLEYLSGWAEADGSWSGTGIWFAFENCTSLTKVTLNSNLRTAYDAFSGCSALKTICVREGINADIRALFSLYGYTWSSADPSVAEISAEGVLSAVLRGTTTVTGRKDGEEDASFTIEVIRVSELAERRVLVGSVEGYRGDTVTVGVRLDDGSAIAAGSFVVSYDTNRVRFTEAAAGAALEGAHYEIDETYTANSVRVSFSDLHAENENPVILVLKFTVKEDARFGSGNISAADVSFTGMSGETCRGKTRNGRISVLYGVSDEQLSLSSDGGTLARDYDQHIGVSVANITEKAVRYYLKAENPYEDIYLNFVTNAYDEEPAVIMPGETQYIDLSVFLQNAENREYSIPVTAYIEKDGEFYRNSVYNVDFMCHIPEYRIEFTDGEVTESNQAAAYYLRNTGDPITDLTLSVRGEISDYVRFRNTYENYEFINGETITAELIPDLSRMNENGVTRIEGQLVAAGAGQETVHDVVIDITGKEITSLELNRIALYESGNPYYLIEQVSSETNLSEATADNLDRFLNEKGEFTITADSQYACGEDVTDVTLSIGLSDTSALAERTQITGSGTGTVTVRSQSFGDLGIRIEGDRETGELTAFVETLVDDREALDIISKFVRDYGETFDLKKDVEEIIREYGNVDDKYLDLVIGISDKLVGSAIDGAGSLDGTLKDFFEALDKTSSLITGGADVLDALSLLSNPNISDRDKVGSLLLGLGERVAGAVSDPTGGFFSSGWSAGFTLLRQLHDTQAGAGPLSEYSNEDLGNYMHQLVNGSQCTNAGAVNTEVKPMNSLKRGFNGYLGTAEIYRRLGDGRLNERNILDSLGTRSRRTKSAAPNAAPAAAGAGENCSFIYVTGRMSSGSGEFVNRTEGTFDIYLNDEYLGAAENDGLTELCSFGIITDKLTEGSNVLKRAYNTNPGSYQVTADTEISILLPSEASALYVGSLDDFEEIRPLPDFAVYPENIYVNADGKDATAAVIGEGSTLKINVYNRGQRGGWTDVTVSCGDRVLGKTENLYVGAFSGTQVEFGWVPEHESETITVELANKTVDVQERREENNRAEIRLTAAARVRPSVEAMPAGEIELLSDGAETYLTADIADYADIVSVQFLIDGNGTKNEASSSDHGDTRRYVVKTDADELSEGSHEITVRIVYKAPEETVMEERSTVTVSVYEVPDTGGEDDPEEPVRFTDVADPGAWYYNSVYWAVAKGVTSGYGEGTFRPMANLSRAQTVTFLYNLAGKPDVSGLEAAEFSDVPRSEWYYSAVKWAVANRITSGYGEGTFRPNVTCNRAMIVTFLANYAKAAGTYKEPTTSASFKDVKAKDWFKKSVDWAVENGITSGYGQGTFSPNVTCNRAMMVTFLKKVAELPLLTAQS